MKKLYRRGGTVHPSPPIISDHLSFLPAAILSLAAALSLDDREVLAYLISSSSSNSNKTNNTHLNSNSSSSPYNSPRGTTNRKSSGGGGGGDHPARFNCNCFRCYTSYWVRWDESPNRELIHEIIDAFEEGLLAKTKAPSSSSSSKLSRKERRNHNKRVMMKNKKEDRLVNNNNNNNKVEESTSSVVISSGDVDDDDEENKGSVRRFVSFVGERIWGTVWRSTI